MKNTTDIDIRRDAGQTVLDMLSAINEGDFATAHAMVGDDFKFDGVMGSRDSAEAYFADLPKMKMHYSVIRSFSSGKDVCILSNLRMGDKDQEIFCCSWYQFRQGK